MSSTPDIPASTNTNFFKILNGDHLKKLHFFLGHLSFIKNITPTAVTNIMEQRILLIFRCISNSTFRMLRHTSSEVTVKLSYNKFKTE